MGLRTGNKSYHKMIINITGIEPQEEEIEA
jgi:hypothetical protein